MDNFRVYFNKTDLEKGKKLMGHFSDRNKNVPSTSRVFNLKYSNKKYFVLIPTDLREEFLQFLEDHKKTYKNFKTDLHVTEGFESLGNILIRWKRKKNM
jgi:hypothetical protein